MTPDEARDVVRETVNEVFDRLGVDLTNREQVDEFRLDLQFARRQRKGAEEFGRTVKKASITVTIGAFAWLIWYGIQYAIKGSP